MNANPPPSPGQCRPGDRGVHISVSSAWAGHAVGRFGRSRIMLLMSPCMVVGAAVTLADALPIVILGLAVFTFGYFAVHALASGWLGVVATLLLCSAGVIAILIRLRRLAES